MIPGLSALIAELPDEAIPFDRTEFPFPVSQALFGSAPDLKSLREESARLDESEAAAQDAAWVALGAAEAVESAQDDRSKHFLSDGQFRGAVFTGIKWRPASSSPESRGSRWSTCGRLGSFRATAGGLP